MKHWAFLTFFRLPLQAHSFITNKIWRMLSDQNEKLLQRRKQNSPVEAYERSNFFIFIFSPFLLLWTMLNFSLCRYKNCKHFKSPGDFDTKCQALTESFLCVIKKKTFGNNSMNLSRRKSCCHRERLTGHELIPSDAG